MKCERCGAEINAGMPFCMQCGKKIQSAGGEGIPKQSSDINNNFRVSDASSENHNTPNQNSDLKPVNNKFKAPEINAGTIIVDDAFGSFDMAYGEMNDSSVPENEKKYVNNISSGIVMPTDKRDENSNKQETKSIGKSNYVILGVSIAMLIAAIAIFLFLVVFY